MCQWFANATPLRHILCDVATGSQRGHFRDTLLYAVDTERHSAVENKNIKASMTNGILIIVFSKSTVLVPKRRCVANKGLGLFGFLNWPGLDM
jgi:hypothetical protein